MRAGWALVIVGCGSPREIECTYTAHEPTLIAIAPAPYLAPTSTPAPTPRPDACPKKPKPVNSKWHMGFDNPIDIADVENETCIVVAPGHVWCRGRIASHDGEETTDDERRRLRYGNGRDWIQIRGITDAVELVVDAWTACARRRTGTVACWGYSYSNGLREPHKPVLIPNLTGATALTSVSTAIVNGVVMQWNEGYGEWLHPAAPLDCTP